MKGLSCADAMAIAYHEGRKTQTRRVIRPQPPDDGTEWGWPSLNGGVSKYFVLVDGIRDYVVCPYGEVGDIVYVRECFCVLPDCDKYGNPIALIQYRADCHGIIEPNPWKWLSTFHIAAKWAARTFLRITAIRVERLRDISDCDAKEEGSPIAFNPMLKEGEKHIYCFQNYWDKIAKPGEKWVDNPWVWVIETENVNGKDIDNAVN